MTTKKPPSLSLVDQRLPKKLLLLGKTKKEIAQKHKNPLPKLSEADKDLAADLFDVAPNLAAEALLEDLDNLLKTQLLPRKNTYNILREYLVEQIQYAQSYPFYVELLDITPALAPETEQKFWQLPHVKILKSYFDMQNKTLQHKHNTKKSHFELALQEPCVYDNGTSYQSFGVYIYSFMLSDT